jgi:transposase
MEGLAAEVVMADTAYDADHLRKAIAAKGALAVIPNDPSHALKHPLDKPVVVGQEENGWDKTTFPELIQNFFEWIFS